MYDGATSARAARVSHGSKHGSAPNGVATRTVRVKKGETLSLLAGRHGTTVSELRALNNLPPGAGVRAGQRLKVPAEG
jgi:LysM repeat protein